MSKKRTRAKRGASENGINWKVLGGVLGLGGVGLIALLIFTVTQPPTVAEPTPALAGNVTTLADYCEANSDRCLSVGAADAPNTVVEISDYGCSHCRDFNLTSGPVMQEEYVATGEVRWWIFPFALSETTIPSAEALFCAAEQVEGEQLIAFHETLFELQTTSVAHQPEGFVSVAQNVGLDVTALEACVADGTYERTVRLNQQAAAQVGVNSTPSFFVNGTLLRGNRPLADFVQQFEG